MGRFARLTPRPSPRQLAPVVVLLLVAAVTAAIPDPSPGPPSGAGAGASPRPPRPPVEADGGLGGAALPDELPAAEGSRQAPAAAAPTAPPAPAPSAPTRVVRRPPERPNRSAETPPPPAPATSHARYDGDVPDPSLLAANGTYWAFATQSGLHQIQVLSSQDLSTWELRGDALGHLPTWAEWGWAWAPAVLSRATGYVLYYTTRHAETGLQCISRATSVVPQGPYVDASTEPFVCQFDRGGSIDPQPFVDLDGTAWLLWKSEGTLDGEPTRIWTRQLTSDGLGLQGAAHELLATAAPWEGPIIEGPAMLRADGHYHLLYAGNRWETAAYAIGHARCASVTGPCTRANDGPLLGSAGPELGPGSPAPLVTLSGEIVLGYHAWTAPAVGYPGGARRLHLAKVQTAGDRLVVTRPWSPL